MERIAVISDTHIPERASSLPASLMDTIAGCDLLVHAGDFTRIQVLDELANFMPVKAVYGNMDEDVLQRKLPERVVFQVAGITVGVTHGWGAPVGIIQRISSIFAGDRPDVVIFGHTHQPLMKQYNGLVYLNPGSPTDTVFAPYFSFGILEIEQGRIKKMNIIRLQAGNSAKKQY